ncbi:unnamed protein product [Rhizoctonia solani]|uniref:EamA domain-containing protein n=1 Tax=Rhizoctonia solani TaxID=456999 RepID=A0A8H3C2N1_9AGAM|nr:unnamed protein product [Rhizoctonia solani]CAE6526577.1 unnamed protein product [Rhizoctonia solani]
MTSYTLSGGSAANGVFVTILFAYVLQTELTQYVQSSLHFRQPYLLFYIAHSAFTLVLPAHLLYLKCSTGTGPSAYLSTLWDTMQTQILAPQSTPSSKFSWARYTIFVSLLTIGITCPALLWYASVSLASLSDITALFNTHAFWAYILSTALLPPPPDRPRWQPYKLLAVLLACIGVFTTVYGSADGASPGTNPFLGSLLALVSAASYALYQVAYKKWAVPTVAIASAYDDDDEAAPLAGDTGELAEQPLPFGLFANFVTSTAGLATLGVLWIPMVASNWFGEGGYQLPGDMWTAVCVGLIALSGLVFNAGFMILLSLWGPIVASVGNLLTIVLVMLADVILSRDLSVITFWSLIGSGLIISGFAILVWEYTTLR